jgi:hypothetical protein
VYGIPAFAKTATAREFHGVVSQGKTGKVGHPPINLANKSIINTTKVAENDSIGVGFGRGLTVLIHSYIIWTRTSKERG